MFESSEHGVLAAKIAAVREIYNLIDKKTPLLVDAETSLEDALALKSKYQKKYCLRNVVLYTLAGTIALLIPTSLVGLLFSINLYYFTPLIALAIVMYFRNDYQKNKAPALIKSIDSSIESYRSEINDAVDMIMSSYTNIKEELNFMLRATTDNEFIAQMSAKGMPLSCKNIIALDYMYQAVTRKFAYPFSDAIKHFDELKVKLSESTDEKGKKLYEEIMEGELRAEYRDCIIARCAYLEKKEIKEAIVSVQEKNK